MHLSRRHILSGLAGAAILPITGHAQENSNPDFSDSRSAAAEHMDYAKARESFRTRLLVRGASPKLQRHWETAGRSARDLSRWPDGSIPLIAWINEYEPSSRLRPGVLFLHGGNATGEGHWELMRPYAEAGFVVMLPSFRGENGQAGNYSGFYDETPMRFRRRVILKACPV